MQNPIEKIIKIAKLRGATPARVINEICKGGWEKTGFSGKSATTQSDRRGLKIIAMKLNLGSKSRYDALTRKWDGSAVRPLPLP